MNKEEINKLLKDNPIKIIKFDDIEVPVEWLKQSTVNINGDDYIKLQQENKELKIQVSSREEVTNKYKEVIDRAVLELVNIDGDLSNSQLSDRICNLIDILKEVE